jgi:uncharacterized protein (DUF427 family)
MSKAIWNGKVLAASDDCEIIEGNKYFPPESINREYFEESQTHTECPSKGTAHYYHLKVEANVNVDAAWFYPAPKEAALNIKGYVAFWRGVEIVD